MLDQAQAKGKHAAVAQYLVGAKLALRYPNRAIPVHPSNKGDRKSRTDPDARRADFDLERWAIEVTVAPPDDKHLEQIASVLDDSEAMMKLLVRESDLTFWIDRTSRHPEIDRNRLAINSIERFVGENITEIAEFSSSEPAQLQQLFTIYNDRWIASVGTPGMRIVIK